MAGVCDPSLLARNCSSGSASRCGLPVAQRPPEWHIPPHHVTCLGSHISRHDLAALLPHLGRKRVRGACSLAVHATSRRVLLSTLTSAAAGAAALQWGAVWPAHAAATLTEDIALLQQEAVDAYSRRRFQDAVNALTQIMAKEPQDPRWVEMRAQALVDGKNFEAALKDFDKALSLTPELDLISQARLLSGRALAYEGMSSWEPALQDYSRALSLALQGGESYDPYVVNSMGNCLNSLGRWQEAREQYLLSSEIFQQARGFRGRPGETSPRLDGAVFAASNAALMLAQLGDTEGAKKEMVRISRRAPGSADMRAALAVLYWSAGQQQEAEEVWAFACDSISVGCSKYQDLDWLRTVRRWPPVMVQRMQAFLALA